MHLQSSNSSNSFCYNKKMKYLTTLFLLGLLRTAESLRISSQDHLDEEPYVFVRLFRKSTSASTTPIRMARFPSRSSRSSSRGEEAQRRTRSKQSKPSTLTTTIRSVWTSSKMLAVFLMTTPNQNNRLRNRVPKQLLRLPRLLRPSHQPNDLSHENLIKFLNKV